MIKKYLMHKDYPVAEVHFSDRGEVLTVSEIYNTDRFPTRIFDNVNIQASFLRKWLESRSMPINRDNFDMLLLQNHIDTISYFAAYSHNASLTDCYWFASSEDIQNNIHWKDVNFYDNSPNSNIGKIVFCGDYCDISSLDSPDMTTNGNLPKIWQYTDSGYFLIKGEIENKHEVFSEVLSSKIAEKLNIPHVKYYFTYYNNRLCSVCPNIINDNNSELISLAQLRNIKNIHFNNSFSREKNIENLFAEYNARKALGKVLILDYITNNADRHENNISFIRDAENLYISDLSPVYNNGEAFLQSSLDNKVFVDGESRLTECSHEKDLKRNVKYVKCYLNDSDLLTYAISLGKKMNIQKSYIDDVCETLKNRINIFNKSIEKEKEVPDFEI